ncbi:hypothetical protein H0H93_006677 [Arthromyces matolae]|nr:hypothetical protein H0H93_006677 [Arthromyces matolae]
MNTVGNYILALIINNTVGSFLYGSFVVLVFATVTIMISALLSVNWVIDLYLFIREVRYQLLEQSPATFNSQTIADFSRVSFKWIITQTVVQQLMLTLSDAIVIWRAWAIVSNPWIMVFPIFFAVAATACGFGYIAIISSSYDVYVLSFYRSLSTPNVVWDVTQALSFVANAISTLLIAHTLWLHCRSRKQLMIHKRPSRVLQVLSIIIDTGLAFLVFQGTNVVFTLLTYTRYTAEDFSGDTLRWIYTYLTGMYPTIVIFLVKRNASLEETFSLSMPNCDVHPGRAFDKTIIIGPLAFASSQTTTLTLSPSKDDLDANDLQPFTRATV